MAIRFIRKLRPFNRRQSVRLNISCLAKYSVAGLAKKVPALTNLINVSEGGALVVTFDLQLVPKTRIELQFQMPNIGKAIAVQGEVVQSHQKRKDVYQTGVRFLNLKEEDRQVIRDFIHRTSNPKKRTA